MDKKDKKQLKAKITARDARIDTFIARLDKILSTKLDRILRQIQDGKLTGVGAASFLLNSIESLKSSEIKEQVRTLAAIYKEDLTALEEYLSQYLATEGAQVFTNSDIQIVDTLINLEVKKTTGTIGTYLDDVSSEVTSSILTGEKLDIDTIVGTTSARALAQAQTEIATTLSGFSSAINIRKAEDLGLYLFEYAGPDDKLTRPFCNKLLERKPSIYTLEEISKMDNGQNLSVKIHGGGWNCRHEWMALSEKKARELGYAVKSRE